MAVDRVRRRHPVALRVDNQAGQQARRLCPAAKRSLMSVGGKPVLNDLPEVDIDDRFVLTGIYISLMRDLAAVKSVLEQCVQRSAGEAVTAL